MQALSAASWLCGREDPLSCMLVLLSRLQVVTELGAGPAGPRWRFGAAICSPGHPSALQGGHLLLGEAGAASARGAATCGRLTPGT